MLSVAEFFEQADALPVASLAELVGSGGVVVVAPHPDDETLGCGGLLALCAQEARACRIIVVTDGTGSHPNSRDWPAARLRAKREDETRTAAAALGLPSDAVDFLRRPDRYVAAASDGPMVIAAIASHAREIAATALLVTWRGDPHGDHQVVAELSAQAQRAIGPHLRLWSYPIWGHTRTDSERDAPSGARLMIADVLEKKKHAITCHETQITGLIADDPDGFRLDADMIARFERPFEIYLRDA